MEILFVIILVSALVWRIFRSKPNDESSPIRRQQRDADINPRNSIALVVVPTVPRNHHLFGAGKSAMSTRWIPPGESVLINGVTITTGMIYLGTVRHSYDYSGSAHVIDPSLKAADNMYGHEPGSIPEYGTQFQYLDQSGRRTYLDWLARGRRDSTPGAGVGLLFLYGLEHRVFVDKTDADVPIITEEIIELLKLFGSSYAFNERAQRFLQAIQIAAGVVPLTADVAPRSTSYGELPLTLRAALGREIATGRLSGDWLFAWYMGLRGSSLRVAASRCPQEFRALYLGRFIAAYPKGLGVRRPARLLSLEYQASAGYRVKMAGIHETWPDPDALSAPQKVAEALANECCDALDSVSRFLGKNPDASGTLAAHLLLPHEILNQSAPALLALRATTDAMMSNGFGQVVFGDLAGETGLFPPSTTKWSSTMAGQLSKALAAIEIGMEPDTRFGGKLPASTDTVALFRAPSGGPIDAKRPEYTAARLVVLIGAMAAQADAGNTTNGFDAVATEIQQMHGMSQIERARLSAYLATLRQTTPSQKTAFASLTNRPPAEREVIARLALRVLSADGRIAPSEVLFAEKLYRAMKLPVERLYSDLHAQQSSTPFDDELPVVSAAEVVAPGLAIPARPAGWPPMDVSVTTGLDQKRASSKAKRTGSTQPQSAIDAAAVRTNTPTTGAPSASIINTHRLERTRRETADIQDFMSGIFSDPDDLPADGIVALDAENITSGSSVYSGLQAEYAPIVDKLLSLSGAVSKSELQRIVTMAGLFLDATIEVINDWSYGRFDEPLIEEASDSQSFVVAGHLLNQLKSAA
jgi:hypothetical protein